MNLETDAIRSRIISEIEASKTRIDLKRQELDTLETTKKELESRINSENESKALSVDAKHALIRNFERRIASLQKKMYDVEPSHSHVAKNGYCCHVNVYYSHDGFETFVVSPKTTCETFVYQVIDYFRPNYPYDTPEQKKFLLDKRMGLPATLDWPYPYTLVYNKGKRPGLWDEQDLDPIDDKDKEKEKSLIQVLEDLAGDSNRGYGMNGKEVTTLNSRSLRMLPCLYLVKREKEARDQNRIVTLPVIQESDEESIAILQEHKRLSSLMNSDARLFEGRRSEFGLHSYKSDASENYTMEQNLQSQNTDGFKIESLTLPGSESQEVSPETPKPQRFIAPRNLEKASAFDAYISILLTEPDIIEENNSSIRKSTENKTKEEILTLASLIIDYAWFGPNDEDITLSHRTLVQALGLKSDSETAKIWMKVFDGIVSGSAERPNHRITFREFQARYDHLRRIYYSKPNEKARINFGTEIDYLVHDMKQSIQSTYSEYNVEIPIYVWNRRFRFIISIVGFAFAIILGISFAQTFVSIRSSLPDPILDSESIISYYNWSAVLCGRLIKDDIINIRTRQDRVSFSNIQCDHVALLENLNQAEQQLFANIGSGWTDFQSYIPGAFPAVGTYVPSGYPPSGYEYINFMTRNVSVQSGLDVSTRVIVVDFDIFNMNLQVSAHAQYILEIDSSGALLSRIQFENQKSMQSGFNFSENALLVSVFLGTSLILILATDFDFGQVREEAFQRFHEVIRFNTLFLVAAFVCFFILIFWIYDATLIGLGLLFFALGLSLLGYSLDQPWNFLLDVFWKYKINLLALILQFIFIVIGYTFAMEAWFNHTNYPSYTFGQQALGLFVFGTIPRYSYHLYPNSYTGASDVIAVFFGMLFLVLATSLIFSFYAVIVVGLTEKNFIPSWGWIDFGNRKTVKPA